MQAGSFANHRYSPLQQINAGNVNKLQVAWMFSTGVLRGHEGSPLVVGDTMYLVTPFPNNVFALDLCPDLSAGRQAGRGARGQGFGWTPAH